MHPTDIMRLRIGGEREKEVMLQIPNLTVIIECYKLQLLIQGKVNEERK